MSRTTSLFVALPVGQGDAFLLREGLRVALVDGGRSRRALAPQLRGLGIDRIDLAVCTHNDVDHSAGILGFLEGGFPVAEVWLPGSWTDRLQDVLRGPEAYMEELLKNLTQLEIGEQTAMDLTQLGDGYAEVATYPESESARPVGIDDLLSDTLGEVDTEGPWPWRSWGPLPPPPWLHQELPFEWWYHPAHRVLRDPARWALLWESIEAGEMIRRIALAAWHAGAVVRWMDYRSAGADSIQMQTPRLLMPVNAREVAVVRPRHEGQILRFLALTRSNKESLVLQAPGSHGARALFTADSDLSFVSPIPWSESMLITAPHHGSEANARAYQRMQNETRDAFKEVWVRSDGRFRSRPGPSFLGRRPESRYCTLCRGSIQPKQTITMKHRSGRWNPVGCVPCSCRA